MSCGEAMEQTEGAGGQEAKRAPCVPVLPIANAPGCCEYRLGLVWLSRE